MNASIRTLTALATGAALLLPAGAATAVTQPTGSPAAPTASAATVSGTVRTVAAPPRSAKVVARVDVDGDRKADTVRVWRLPYRNSQDTVRWMLRVDTATKRVSQTVLDTGANYPDNPFFAAAPLDGARGAEIVLEKAPGAHTRWFTVFSWRNGRLQRPFNPESRSPEWPTEWSGSATVGYRFYTQKGRRYMVSTVVSGDKRQSGTQKTYRWVPAGWSRVSTKKVSYNPGPQLHQVAGWHAAGMPVGH